MIKTEYDNYVTQKESDIPSKGQRPKASPEEGLILSKYFLYKPLHSTNIDSYDWFIFNGLQEHTASRPIMHENIIINLHYGTPSPNMKNGRYIYPHALLNTERTYEINFPGYIHVSRTLKNGRKEAANSITKNIFKLPLMLKSKICPLSKLRTPEEFEEVGASMEDPAGYFIVTGLERSMPLAEKLKHNQIFASAGRPKGGIPYMHVYQLVVTGVSTTQMTVILDQSRNPGEKVRKEKLKIKEVKFSSMALGLIKGSKSHTKQFNKTNILSLCFMIKTIDKNDKMWNKLDIDKKMETVNDEFKDRMKKIIPAEQWSKCYHHFSNTILAYYNTDQYQELKTMENYLQTSDNNYKFSDFVREHVFPTIKESDKEAKITQLALLTSRLLQYQSGYIKETSRNNWANKTLDGPGQILSRCYKKHYKNLIANIQKEMLSQKLDNWSITAIAEWAINKISNNTLTNDFLNDFKNVQSPATRMAVAKKKQSRQPDITMLLNTNNSIERHSLLTKIVTRIDSNTKSLEVRAMQGTQVYYVCATTTTDSETCGLVKFLAMTTYITIGSDEELLKQTLFKNKVISEKYVAGKYTIPTMINGVLQAWGNENSYQQCVKFRRQEKIDRHVTAARTLSGCLEIYCDSGRMVRPVLCLEDGKIKMLSDKNWKNLTFQQILKRGYADYIDTFESDYSVNRIASTFNTLDIENNRVAILKENLDELIQLGKGNTELAENYRLQITAAEKFPHNYVNLHPITSFGVTVSLAPFPSHSQSCRVSYQAKMFNQAIGVAHSNPYRHINARNSLYNTRPPVDSIMTDIFGFGNIIPGDRVMLCFLADRYNQEDAMVINQRTIDLGKFRYQKSRIYRHTLGKGEEFMRLPDIKLTNPEHPPEAFRFIGEDGIPMIGAYLRKKDCAIACYKKEIFGDESEGGESYTDKCVYLAFAEEGRVSDVMLYHNGSDKSGAGNEGLTLSVKIDSYLLPTLGDKFALRYAQKVTIGIIRSDIDMPWIIDGPMAGLRPDVLISPKCIPTRMTIGTLLEPIVSLAYSQKGLVYDASAYNDFNMETISNILTEAGISSMGEFRMAMGDTGEEMNAHIFTGPAYYQQLGHIAREKLMARAVGEVNKHTRQAQASKKDGSDRGTKFSEFERDAALKHGAAFFVQERFCTVSDAHKVVLCGNCFAYAKYEQLPHQKTRNFICTNCGKKKEHEEKKFGRLVVPYTFQYISNLFVSIGVRLVPIVTSEESYLAGLENNNINLINPEGISIDTQFELAEQEENEEETSMSKSEDESVSEEDTTGYAAELDV